ncbi:MAG: hypothetical protein ACXWQO_03970 [Bdellovibrionota bacterium]
MKITNIALLALAMISSVASAAPTTKEEFLMIAAGNYQAVSPSRGELGDTHGAEPSIMIQNQDGDILLYNELNLGAKFTYGLYKIDSFGCAPTGTSCKFTMRVQEPGVYVHFLGVNPFGEITERNGILTLEIYPDYFVAGQKKTPRIVVQRAFP